MSKHAFLLSPIPQANLRGESNQHFSREQDSFCSVEDSEKHEVCSFTTNLLFADGAPPADFTHIDLLISTINFADGEKKVGRRQHFVNLVAGLIGRGFGAATVENELVTATFSQQTEIVFVKGKSRIAESLWQLRCQERERDLHSCRLTPYRFQQPEGVSLQANQTHRNLDDIRFVAERVIDFLQNFARFEIQTKRGQRNA